MFTKIELDYSWRVDGKPLVRVYNNTEQTRISIDKLSLKKENIKS